MEAAARCRGTSSIWDSSPRSHGQPHPSKQAWVAAEGFGRGGKQFPGSVDLANTCAPGAGLSPFPTEANGRSPYTCLPISPETTFQEFRVLFLRRLWQPLPMSSFTCRCGRPLDSRGHHRAACPLAGVLGRRGFSLESAAARVCREAGGRVTTNVRVQDMDLLPLHHLDNRRLEVVVDDLPLFRGAQLAIDTTMVSAVRS